MSLERDLQSKIAALALNSISVSGVAEVFSTTIIDTLGFRDITFIVTPSAAIGATLTSYIVAEESDDGITYTDVAYNKWLPTRNQNAVPAGQLLFDALAPYYMTFGLTSVKRYLKIGINTTVYDQSARTVGIMTVMQAENQDFIAYDSPVAVPGDNLP